MNWDNVDRVMNWDNVKKSIEGKLEDNMNVVVWSPIWRTWQTAYISEINILRIVGIMMLEFKSVIDKN
jgi:hypothetical protein